jgi:hypothetical protein
MSEFQTVPQDLTAILRGSGKLEISPYQATPTWQDAGSLSALEYDEKLEMSKEENDNADADENPSSQEVTVKATLHEALKAAIWDILRGSFDTKTVNSGSIVSGATYDFPINTTVERIVYPLPGQNASGLVQSTISIKKDPAGTNTTLVAGTDFVSGKDAAGRWGIMFLAGGQYDATKLIRVTYTYTPAASIDYESGNSTVLPWFMVRITTKNTLRPYYFIGYKCKIRTGKKFTYPKDEDKDPRVKVPIEIVCKTDALYHNNMIYKTNQTGGM